MRTKILLLGAAALAAGLATSVAQSNVYSVNIAGYVNQVLPAGAFALVSNPLDDGTNTVTSLGLALPNKSSVQVWNGTGFDVASKAGGAWNTNIAIAVGQGFFVKAGGVTPITNAFVGNVKINSGATNSQALAGGVFSLVGTPVPYQGSLNDPYNVLSLNIGATLPNKSSIQVWNGGGFDVASKAGGTWNTNIALVPGQGFFVKPNSATNWVQALPAN